MEQDQIVELAERCRRLARQVTDGSMRNSLEALADEYEAQLPGESGGDGEGSSGSGFMLSRQ